MKRGICSPRLLIFTIEFVGDSLARHVCNKCARLPLIIAAVGKALYKKPKVLWEDAHHQLMKCKPEKIKGIPPDAYACLAYSFNILNPDAYLCLLLCSLAGEDEEIQIEFLFRLVVGSGLLEDWNTYTLEAARNRVNAMVSELKSSSLLLKGRYYDSVKLHDICINFCKNFHILWHVVVESCGLSTIFTCSVAKGLQELEILRVRSCGSVEEIVTDDERRHNDEELVHVEEISFPKLTFVALQDLPNLKSFCPSANYCFKLPSLEFVFITRCPQLLSFTPGQISTPEVSFPSLGILELNGLKINLDDSTSKLRSVNIVGSERPAPQLIIPPYWLLASRDLQSLDVSNCDFQEGDLFSLLGKNNPYGTISFRRLLMVRINSCGLSTIFTCSVAKGLQELERLEVRSCGSVEEIVTDDERRRNDEELVHVEEISFPKLRTVKLEDLPNLKSFCPSANYSFKMPSLRDVFITRCPQLLSFTPRQISTPEVFVRITNLSLVTCEEFTRDINSYLHQIRNTQQVRSCGSVEEIVTDDERRCNDEELVHVEEISFPKLREIRLVDLPNLKSFCPNANYCFKIPSLENVTIARCPQLLSFTPGQISTPEVRVRITNPSLDTCEYTTDINSWLHQMIRNTQQADQAQMTTWILETAAAASSSMLNPPADQAQTQVARNPVKIEGAGTSEKDKGKGKVAE